jgi:hypothetical protein
MVMERLPEKMRIQVLNKTTPYDIKDKYGNFASTVDAAEKLLFGDNKVKDSSASVEEVRFGNVRRQQNIRRGGG